MKHVPPAAAVVGLALVVVTGSCAGGRAEPPEPAAPRHREVREPDFVNGGECPPSRHTGLPADAGCVSSVAEGPRTLSVYALLDGDRRPQTWRIRLSGGDREIDQRLRAGNASSYPRAVGVTDLDDDGTTEWWVKVADYASHGAAWAGLNLFVSTADRLAPVLHEGEPLTINFGGISRLGEGASCRDGYLVALRVWALDRQNTRWRVSERRYELEGTHARFLDRRMHSLIVESYTDPDLVRNFRVECDGSTFTPFG